jgi:Fe-S cluster assembly ATP-binding protein
VPVPVLEVRELTVAVGDRLILRNLSLVIEAGEVHVLLGPNGGGKTTLLMAVMGIPGYRVRAGRILLMGEDITDWDADERSRAGIALAYQRPPPVRGVTLGTLTERILRPGGRRTERARALAEKLDLAGHLDRDLNAGLSGGEVKRSEVMQLMALKPRLALFDEPESGVDMDSISRVGEAMRDLLGIGRGRKSKAGLIVTHTGNILRHVPASRGHVLMKGTIVCRGVPAVLFEDIREHGFEGCLTCRHCRSA